MTALLLFAAASTPAHAWSTQELFNTAISRVEQLVNQGDAQSIVQQHGLNLLNVTWEDTGRYKGSSVGPNISDMTIGVRDAYGALHPMPVIRFNNFTDKTADVRASNFFVNVGNEDGVPLRPVALSTLLQNPRAFLTNPGSWAGSRSSLWSDRDTEVLVSAQACLLPVPREGEAVFTPVLYNYQSYPGNPAVLAIVATRQGTSMQVIENDGGYMSQPLFFNTRGERAPFVAERVSDWQAHGGDDGNVYTHDEARGADAVLLIQVPLKQVAPPNYGYYGSGGMADNMDMAAPAAESSAKSASPRRSDIEQAVVSYGQAEGPFRELDYLPIERDTRFPIRVTVQFYKATTSGYLTDADVADLRAQIDNVYSHADAVGSLVTQGYTGRQTEWTAPRPPVTSPATATWANGFWNW